MSLSPEDQIRQLEKDIEAARKEKTCAERKIAKLDRDIANATKEIHRVCEHDTSLSRHARYGNLILGCSKCHYTRTSGSSVHMPYEW